MNSLGENERLDEIGFGGLKLIQDTEGFRYGIDSVLLSDFAAGLAGKGKELKAADLGSGNAVIPLIMQHKCARLSKIYAIEKQERGHELALRNVELNGLGEKIIPLCRDVKDIDCILRSGEEGMSLGGSLDMVVSNPPYFEGGRGIKNAQSSKLAARQETTAGLSDFTALASRLLKKGGGFFLILNASRLADALSSARECGLEPRHLRMVASRRGEAPKLFLMHAVKDGGKELRLLPELIIYEGKRSYTEEILKIYEKSQKLA